MTPARDERGVGKRKSSTMKPSGSIGSTGFWQTSRVGNANDHLGIGTRISHPLRQLRHCRECPLGHPYKNLLKRRHNARNSEPAAEPVMRRSYPPPHSMENISESSETPRNQLYAARIVHCGGPLRGSRLSYDHNPVVRVAMEISAPHEVQPAKIGASPARYAFAVDIHHHQFAA